MYVSVRMHMKTLALAKRFMIFALECILCYVLFMYLSFALQVILGQT